jgi:radical SAM superfamily enzyme YgiQ (UPF0313 family)
VPRWGISSGLLVPPLGPAYLAASLREAGLDVSIVDPVAEDPFEVNPVPDRPLVTYGWSPKKVASAIPEDTRYVGLSCTFSHEWPVAKELARLIHERLPEATIVAGGEHITAAPELSVQECPEIRFAVLGEGEETLLDLIRSLEAGRDPALVPGLVFLRGPDVVRTPARQRIRSVDTIPPPAWDLIPIENFLKHGLSYGVSQSRTMPIMATRGCPYKCTFCSSPTMWTQRWVARSPQDVADEIASYVERYQATNFDFYDLTAIIRKEWIVDFCRELIKRRLAITWQLPAGTRSEAIDDEVAGLLAQSGHRNLVYAPESGSERMLTLILKKVNLERMLDSMRAAIRNGISVKLNVIIGFPQETPADVIQTYKFLAQCAWVGVDDATLNTFCPYPGSELFRDLQERGRIPRTDDDYFYGLATMGDVRDAVSYSDHIGGRALLAYKLLGIFIFYSLSYLFRPRRIFDTLWHLYRGNHQTRIEKALSSVLAKARIFRRRSAISSPQGGTLIVAVSNLISTL